MMMIEFIGIISQTLLVYSKILYVMNLFPSCYCSSIIFNSLHYDYDLNRKIFIFA